MVCSILVIAFYRLFCQIYLEFLIISFFVFFFYVHLYLFYPTAKICSKLSHEYLSVCFILLDEETYAG